MGALAVDDRAFIRPSPSAGVLGGVTRATLGEISRALEDVFGRYQAA
jgi:putative protein kinase ArgK-like GTPase of G3E family